MPESPRLSARISPAFPLVMIADANRRSKRPATELRCRPAGRREIPENCAFVTEKQSTSIVIGWVSGRELHPLKASAFAAQFIANCRQLVGWPFKSLRFCLSFRLTGKGPPTCSTSPASSKLCAITTQSPFRLKQSLGSAKKHNLFTHCYHKLNVTAILRQLRDSEYSSTASFSL